MRRVALVMVMAMAILGRTAAGAKIRDVATVVGARSNHLIGYGLVIGLKGTGDGKGLAASAMKAVLQRLLKPGDLRTGCVIAPLDLIEQVAHFVLQHPLLLQPGLQAPLLRQRRLHRRL